MAKVTTWVNRTSGKETNRVTVRIEHRMALSDMVNGLCSEHARNFIEGDDELPESLSAAKIIDTVRDQYEYWGTNAVWTWVDELGYDESKTYTEWAERLIIAAFPEMGENRG